LAAAAHPHRDGAVAQDPAEMSAAALPALITLLPAIATGYR